MVPVLIKDTVPVPASYLDHKIKRFFTNFGKFVAFLLSTVLQGSYYTFNKLIERYE
jgi:hypothetical protein